MADGHKLEDIQKHTPDTRNHVGHYDFTMNYLDAKRIVVDKMLADVFVFRDVKGLYTDVNALCITYIGSNAELESWLSRVFLASGAWLGYCVDGPKCMFSHADELTPELIAKLAQLGTITKDAAALDKNNWCIALKNSRLIVHSGRCLSLSNEKLEWYFAVNHGWQMFGRSILKMLLRDLTDVLISMGCKPINFKTLNSGS